MDSATKQELAKLASGPVRWECPLCDYTSFGIGGPAAALIVVESVAELQGLLLFLQARTIPWRIIGKGSNLLVSDGGFDGVILLLGAGFAAISDEDGVQVDDVVTDARPCRLHVGKVGADPLQGFEAGLEGRVRP